MADLLNDSQLDRIWEDAARAADEGFGSDPVDVLSLCLHITTQAKQYAQLEAEVRRLLRRLKRGR